MNKMTKTTKKLSVEKMILQSLVALAVFSCIDAKSKCYECLPADSPFRPEIQLKYDSPWYIPGWNEHYWQPNNSSDFLSYINDEELKIIDVRLADDRKDFVLVDHLENQHQIDSFRSRKIKMDYHAFRRNSGTDLRDQLGWTDEARSQKYLIICATRVCGCRYLYAMWWGYKNVYYTYQRDLMKAVENK